MGEWIISNPAKGKKSNYRRFITNWLSRSQDRGGTAKGGSAPRGRADNFNAMLDAFAAKGEK